MIQKVIKSLRYFFRIVKYQKYIAVSYSQEGEDLILNRYFNQKTTGFYVDIGAHHPQRFSNTFFFYNKGWRGINVDAMPGSMDEFNRLRKRDINIEAAIGEGKSELTYYMFNEPALNGFSTDISAERDSADNGFKIIGQKSIFTRTLADILEETLPANTTIDFISVDVEGLDLQVLRSNNWERFRPKVVLVEILDFRGINDDPVAIFLKKAGYEFYAKSHYTAFFTDGR